MVISDYIRFLAAFATKPGEVGAVAPSSSHMARRMVEWIDWPGVQTVVEYGAGTGAFTRAILERRPKNANYFAVEINDGMIRNFRRHFPAVPVVHDDVANIRDICEQQAVAQVDAIISGLPWSIFPEDKQADILDAATAVLRPGGQFTTFAYLQGLLLPTGQKFRKRLQKHFSHVETSPIVWRNVPPAFVYRCLK